MSENSCNRATYDITNFTIREMSESGKAMRAMGDGSASMEETSGRIVRHFYDGLVDADGERAAALVRFYKTHPFHDLDIELQGFARVLLGGEPPSSDMKCLVLLATAGDKTEWNSRKISRGHQAIPLPSEEAVNQAPMVSNLITQLGIPLGMVLRPEPELLLDMEQKTYNVFHVPEALGSPYIPAQQEFVTPCGIRSVLGFGGLLPSGEMFAVIMFFKVPVSRETANLFKTISLSVKMAVLPFDGAVFS
ncbi:MAG: hypothetical protein JJE30_12085 [Desulfuromonadales bacterium]|nr:hypothetical protein [Desulfuromonadales bacterium]